MKAIFIGGSMDGKIKHILNVIFYLNAKIPEFNDNEIDWNIYEIYVISTLEQVNDEEVATFDYKESCTNLDEAITLIDKLKETI